MVSLKLILPWAEHSVYKKNASFIKMFATKIFVQEENLALAPRGFILWSYFFLIRVNACKILNGTYFLNKATCHVIMEEIEILVPLKATIYSHG